MFVDSFDEELENLPRSMERRGVERTRFSSIGAGVERIHIDGRALLQQLLDNRQRVVRTASINENSVKQASVPPLTRPQIWLFAAA